MSQQTIGSVLIAGGGIGAIQAALDLANSGFYVYMTERSASIGGVMAQLDKTFPTNDCSMCIMSPKLVEVGRHLNIELITLAEIMDIRGTQGDFEVEVFQKSRYVDMDKCIACGACAEKCPKKVMDEYNTSLVKRKAIYVPYPQAVPLKYAIDVDHCIKLTKGKCGNCEKVCPAGAIRYDDTDQTLNLKVGAIILAPGFQAYDPSGQSNYAYDGNPDVVTSLEFERLLSASGPNMGHLVRLSDHAEPKRIAWLQCVGSRDINTCDNNYCSSVCCMYAIKQAIIAKEHDPSLECTIYYMDMRTHGKGFEACYNEAREKYGIRFVRSKIHSVVPTMEEPGMQRIRYVDEKSGRTEETDFDLVVLSVGMEIPEDIRRLAGKMSVELTSGHFAKTGSFAPVATSVPGIYVCGAFQGPKDIPQTVIEAGSAALCAGASLASARHSLTRSITVIEEKDVSGERPKIGVFVCHCGINIGGVIDVPAVRDFASTLPYVEYVGDNMYSCSQDTQDTICRLIREKNLNRIVVAACTPRTHDPLFQETLQAAGLNKYLFEMVNIRNHGSWVHKDYPEKATEKAKDLVKMAVARVAQSKPLAEATLEIDQNVLVVGGGLSGMASALSLAEQGYHVHIVEREAELGGNARHLFMTAKGESVAQGLGDMVQAVVSHPQITVHTASELVQVEGFVGNFDSVIQSRDTVSRVRHGVAILATGAKEHKPDEYLHGQDDRVVTGLELDQRIQNNDPSLAALKTAVFIQCVGSREPERPYCSRICCTHTIVSALHLKSINPNMNVFVLYRDIRTYGEKEGLYQEAREKGVIFIRYAVDDKPVVSLQEDHLLIRVTDNILHQPITIEADLVSLAAAIVPYQDEKLAQFFKVPINDEGFFAEAHVKLAPSDFATDGVFLCGLAHYPKPIDESIAQAQAAASSAIRLLSRKKINTIGTVAVADAGNCSGCGVCVAVCPYNAPGLIQEGPLAGKAQVNPVLCKGCGACVASCRSGALRLKGFEDGQIMAMLDCALLN